MSCVTSCFVRVPSQTTIATEGTSSLQNQIDKCTGGAFPGGEVDFSFFLRLCVVPDYICRYIHSFYAFSPFPRKKGNVHDRDGGTYVRIDVFEHMSSVENMNISHPGQLR